MVAADCLCTVCAEINQNLMNLHRIHENSPAILVDILIDLDCRRQCDPHQLDYFLDDRMKILKAFFLLIRPGKGEYLINKTLGPFPCF